ncbi:hypothetical protein N7510_008843 [Penicillium lagena]|uniref:uncharacterized protein n=1 Tax=Penicillium lagena TaxID=94218 RepID=UPI002541DFD1|nr:uncharacterized protein N7510_008843 [Penicillium lagena]KAJ5606062.1 hypothetical protein N7510_008843 [Penicillium lagena]
MKPCTFVTGNPNKVAEAKAILGDKVPVKNIALDLPEIQGTLEEIAKDKCRRASKIVTLYLAPIDDLWELIWTDRWARGGGRFRAGIQRYEQDAGAIYTRELITFFGSKYFLEALGNDGLNKLLESFEDKSAEALKGKIVPSRGPPRFGWDPIFEHEGETLAEMEYDKKNKLSPQYQALLKFQEWLAHEENRALFFENSS